MPPKKATGAAAPKKAAAAPVHGSYKEMIREAIIALKERNGSSRSALKKYIQANNKGVGAGTAFDNQFNRAVKSGVEQNLFSQPKGTSGTVKLAKKEPAAAKPATEKKPAAAKKAKTTTTKKAAAPKKATATKTKAAAPKKATATKTKAAAKPKANTSTKRKTKTPSAAPAIVEEKKVIGKTKSGRVTKGPAKPSNPASKKGAAVKKTPAKKAATPKKKAEAAPAAA